MSHRVTELHNIQAIENISSIMEHGILSYEKASQLPHISVAMNEVQNKREVVSIPGGLRLHQYANLYFCARNPMMYKRKGIRNQLCVLQIERRILTHEGAIITDMNAASSKYVRFHRSPDGLRWLNFDMIYADDWTHPNNPPAYFRHSATKCAEVLIPDCVEIDYISGAYVANEPANKLLLQQGFALPITVNPHMFFAEAL